MIYHKGLVTIMLLQFLFIFVSNCLEYNSVVASGELRCKAEERDALLRFKQGLIDKNDILSSWGSEDDKKECCKWKGVKCSNGTGHVIGLQLISGMGGTISSALLELSYLNHLDLSGNDFGYDEIPEFIGSLQRLEYLDLRDSNFSGVVPHQLGKLTNLRTLNLSWNGLVFRNCSWLSHLSLLSILDLGQSYLQDTNLLQYMVKLPSMIELHLSFCHIPTHFYVNSSSTTLSILDLSNSNLTSSSFHWLFNMSTNLHSIDLSSNHLSAIPDAFEKFTFLEYLDLSFNQITGGIPKSLGNLSHLQTLQLDYNQLSGCNLDIFWQYSRLKTLYLSGNQITGLLPASLWQLSKLQTLDLSSNQITGLLPASLWQLSKLEVLDLSSNQITGLLPASLWQLSKLEVLKLSSNQITGLPPASLWQLSKLEVLDLSWNQITGLQPASLWQLSKLEVLDLSRNQITGSVPDLSALVSLKELHLGNNILKLLPAGLWQLSKLEILDVSFNSIEGTISDVDLSKLHKLKELGLSFNSLVFNVTANWIPPFQLEKISLACCEMGPHFPKWLQTQTLVSILDFSSIGISDEVPKWFWNLSKGMSYLNLSHNQISGTIPDFSMNSTGRFELDISFNNFSGHLPLFGPYFGKLQLNNNMFLGSISSICTIAYDDLSLLDLSNNQFSGELPNCWNNTRGLSILSLANNKLSGHIPHSLGSQKELRILHLSGNNFSGELPSTLKNCKNLEMIDVGGNNLTGNIPAWIGTHLTDLVILGLRHNNFHGSIPPEICYLTKIQILDLSRNFISGKIPQCFNNFTYLVYKNTTYLITPLGYVIYPHTSNYYSYLLVQWKGQETEYRKTLQLVKHIDLSSNRLVGNIPREFSHLRALISLNLSGNYLSGNIISGIGQMEMIESLDLSRNQLSGEIPISLAELHYLAVLDLSDNNLSGKIPSSTQLQSFNASVYAGNGELCGLPLRSCPGDGPNTSITDYGKRENGDEEDDKFITHGFVISMVLGFIFGFWGVVGTLVIKNSWRYAYFNFFNKIKDWIYVTTTLYAAKFKDSSRANGHS